MQGTDPTGQPPPTTETSQETPSATTPPGARVNAPGIADSPIAPDAHPLDPRVIGLWRLRYVIRLGVLLFVVLVSGVIAGLAAPRLLPWILAGWLILAGLGGWLSAWYPGRAYRAWEYRIDARVLETRSGVIFRVTRLLPLGRLQHVDLHRGPLERMFGLASLVLHTAGTRTASIEIPGLDADRAVRLRDHLVDVGGDDAV